MVLYDKNGLFLGLGNQELSLLGYEDMEDFCNYHNDFADLFVNKPGFIVKFKNFSWIDYALHSGTPSKRVLIKTKSGKELDTSLSICEIYLPKEINGSSLFYAVEIADASNRQDFSAFTSSFAPIIQIPESEEKEPLEKSASFVSDTSSLDASFNSFETDYKDDETEEEPLLTIHERLTENEPSSETPSISLPLEMSPFEEEPLTFKLKFDETILEKEPAEASHDNETIEYHSLDQIQADDFSFETTPTLTDTESYPEDTYEALRNDVTLLAIEKDDEQQEAEQEFDLANCAEELGLDIQTLAQIIEEYIDALATSMPLIEDAINTNKRDVAKIEIMKLKSVASHLQIISLFHHFEHLETSLDFDTKEELLHTLDKLQTSVMLFKESIL